MATYSLGLEKLRVPIIKGSKQKSLQVSVYVKTCTRARGLIFITPDCCTEQEINYEIDRLKRELNSLKQQAARFFRHGRPA